MLRAVLVGSKSGPQWQGKLEKHLKKVHIEVCGVWRKPGDPRKGNFGAEIVLITADCCSHPLSRAAKAEARAAGITAVEINHRWASARQKLDASGILARAIQAGEDMKVMPEQPKKPVPQTKIKAPAPAEPEPAGQPEPKPEPEKPKATIRSRREWRKLVRPLLRDDHTLRNAAIEEVYPVVAFNRKTFRAACSEVRREAGIVWKGPGVGFVLEEPKIEEPEPKPKPPASEQPEAPEPVDAPTDIGPLSGGLPENVKTAVQILLAEMREAGVEEVTITEAGKVTYTRRIVRRESGVLKMVW